VKSFANYIKTEFENTLFVSLNDTQKIIYIISVHLTEADHVQFVSALKNNPYIEKIETEFLSAIIKGQKLFDFNEKFIATRKRRKTAGLVEGAGEEEIDEEEEFDEDDESEVHF
jgi:hypothetical protein